MYCQQSCGGQFNRFGPMGRNFCGGGGGYPNAGGSGYRGSTFVLIVVLFVLLIIVGKSYM